VSTALRAKIGHFLLRLIVVGISCAAAVTALAYTADYFAFRYRVARNLEPYGQVTVRHYYAVEQKGGRIQFIFEPPVRETCVHSLFPRAGYLPCWYLERHTEQRTDI
jgi:hypothetical protein